MDRRVREDVLIGGATPSLQRAIIDDKWFSGEEDLRHLGYGKGEIGYLAALEDLKKWWFSGEYEIGGVYRRGKPIGFFSLEWLGDATRTMRLFFFLPPDSRNFGVGWTALKKVLDTVFSRRKVQRVETELLTINPAGDFLKNVGFTEEGTKRYSRWMGPNGFHERIYSILRSEWKRGK